MLDVFIPKQISGLTGKQVTSPRPDPRVQKLKPCAQRQSPFLTVAVGLAGRSL